MTRKAPISDLKLELLALGALSPQEARAVQDALESDPEARARLERLQSDDAILREFTPDDVAAEVARRVALHELAAPARPPWYERLLGPQLGWAVAFAACVLAASLWFQLDQDTAPGVAPPINDDGVRVKGSPTLLIHKVDAAGVTTRLDAGGAVAEGDRLQLSVTRATGLHAVVVSLDGRGQVTLHFPQGGGDGAIRAEGGAPFSLPHSYELDDAPHFERFILITAPAPLDAAAVLDRTRRLAADPLKRELAPIPGLPARSHQASFLLKKAR